MAGLGLEPCRRQVLADLIGHHDGTMLAAGAAEGYRQIALSFANVMREKVGEQIGNALHELGGLGEGPNIAGHSGIAAGEILESRDVVRVGQKSNVEHQVAILRYAVAEAEAVDVNHDVRFVAAAAEVFADKVAKL